MPGVDSQDQSPLVGTMGNWGSAVRQRYDTSKDRLETILRVGSAPEDFVWEAVPSCGAVYHFHGVFINAAKNEVIADNPLHYAETGNGAVTAVSALHGGAQIQTGGVLNNDCTLQTGDNANPSYIYNVSEEVYFTADFKIPTVTNVLVQTGLYADANNWIGLRFDTSVDGNLYFVTRAAAAEATTSLGAPGTGWHRAYVIATASSVKLVIDGGATTEHTTHIPAANLAAHAYVKTLAAANRSLQFRCLRVLQDAP